MVMLHQTRLYKILTAPDWQLAQAKGYTQTALDDADGYVHLSSRDQVAETLKLHYAGVAETHLLEFIGETLTGRLVWEESRGGAKFPHLYSKLLVREAKRDWVLVCDSDGIPQLPGDIDA